MLEPQVVVQVTRQVLLDAEVQLGRLARSPAWSPRPRAGSIRFRRLREVALLPVLVEWTRCPILMRATLARAFSLSS